jgi:hypothetical protein
MSSTENVLFTPSAIDPKGKDTNPHASKDNVPGCIECISDLTVSGSAATQVGTDTDPA